MKNLTAQEMLDFLQELEDNHIDLSKIEVDIQSVTGDHYSALYITEGLYDEKTNNILESITVSAYICEDEEEELN